MPYRSLIVAMVLLVVPALADPDLSTPIATAKSLYAAVEAQDAEAIKTIFYMPTKSDQDLAAVFTDMILAGKQLNEAARKKYGSSGDALGAGMLGKDDLTNLDQAEVKITGDSATLVPPGQTKPMRFHRTGGKWQLMLADYAGAPDADMPRQLALLKKVTKALSDMSVEIDAGKYSTAADAESAIQQKLAGIMIAAAQAATSKPTTRP